MAQHSDMLTNLDMTVMYTMHDAFRRDLREIARIAAKRDGDPLRILRAAAGWELFKTHLHIHHTAEDTSVWPAMRAALANRPDELELIDAMEAEHGRIDPLLEAVDAALADREHGAERLGDVVDALVHEVGGHLTHEETDALPLIDRTLSPETWASFGDDQRKRVGVEGGAKYMPWLLDGASPERVERILGLLPPPLLALYRDVWQPAYSRLDHWGARAGESTVDDAASRDAA